MTDFARIFPTSLEDSTAMKLKAFMEAYAAYFYSDSIYMHELGRAHFQEFTTVRYSTMSRWENSTSQRSI
jgi:hypothetical protein